MNVFRNPFKLHAPDPFLVYENGYYYLTATTGTNITLARSRTLADFQQGCEKKVIWTPKPDAPNSKAIWAPEIHKIDGKWWAYYAATPLGAADRRMFVLEHLGEGLWDGEWKEKGRLIPSPDYWAIDGTVMKTKFGSYFVWSGWGVPDETEDGNIQEIYISKMKSPYELEGERIRLSAPEYEWECKTSREIPLLRVNEGPEAFYTNSYNYIFYSASFCITEHYALGALRIKKDDDPMISSNWFKFSKPLFEKSEKNGVFGVGHNSFIKSPDKSEDWLIYHAFDTKPPYNGGNRHAFAQKFTLDNDEVPIFGEPLPVGEDIAAPSGE